MGRLLWAAVGDPAMMAFPFNASWMPNRVQLEVTRVEGQSGGIRVPADAIVPQPGSGALAPVGNRAFGSAKVVYQVLASPFEDGTEMTMADLLYPFSLIYRWGAGPGGDDAHEPRLKAVLTALQEQLVGIQPLAWKRRRMPWPKAWTSLEDPCRRSILCLATGGRLRPWLRRGARYRGICADGGSRRPRTRRLHTGRSLRPGCPLTWCVTGPQGDVAGYRGAVRAEGHRPEALKSLARADEARGAGVSPAAFVTNGHFLRPTDPIASSSGAFSPSCWRPCASSPSRSASAPSTVSSIRRRR